MLFVGQWIIGACFGFEFGVENPEIEWVLNLGIYRLVKLRKKDENTESSED